MFTRCTRRPLASRTFKDVATTGKNKIKHVCHHLLISLPLQSQLIEQLVSNDPSKRPDSTAVLRMDFLKIEDELIEQLRAQVDKLTELLAEKDDIITLLKHS